MRAQRIVLAAVLAALALGPAALDQAASAAAPAVAGLPLGHTGSWITNSSGQVVILHGLNQVYKVPPYEPSADGFGPADAAFLAANGFNAMRVGVIWGAVEPEPGVYDNAYLASIAGTVKMLAQHGIVSLLDFHQDLFNEAYQGEGAPAWAVQTGGLPNPKLGFPYNYLANPALEFNLDQFWANAPGPGGVGLATRYAAAWAHVAAYFRGNPNVLGFELYNEPFPGTLWETCAVAVVGCPVFDNELTTFYRNVDAAIRKVNPNTMVWFEPNVLFNDGVATDLGTIADPNTGFAFHDYCLTEDFLGKNTLCDPADNLVFANAAAYAKPRSIPELMTEFGATDDLINLQAMVTRANTNMVSWLEWAFTGHDKTSSSPNGQSLVYNPALPPTGSNVDQTKLAVLAEPYPQLISGVPRGWSYAPNNHTFRFTYDTTKAGSSVRFPAGSITLVSTPAVEYPHGYAVQVSGGRVVSAPGAPILRIASCPGVAEVSVTVAPGGTSSESC